MARKRFSAEQIVDKLRESEVEIALQETEKPSEKRGLMAIQYTSLDSNQ